MWPENAGNEARACLSVWVTDSHETRDQAPSERPWCGPWGGPSALNVRWTVNVCHCACGDLVHVWLRLCGVYTREEENRLVIRSASMCSHVGLLQSGFTKPGLWGARWAQPHSQWFSFTDWRNLRRFLVLVLRQRRVRPILASDGRSFQSQWWCLPVFVLAQLGAPHRFVRLGDDPSGTLEDASDGAPSHQLPCGSHVGVLWHARRINHCLLASDEEYCWWTVIVVDCRN